MTAANLISEPTLHAFGDFVKLNYFKSILTPRNFTEPNEVMTPKMENQESRNKSKLRETKSEANDQHPLGMARAYDESMPGDYLLVN